MKKIDVLVVDDSPLMRAWLKKILSTDPMIGEVTTAQDPQEAKIFLQTKRPDVITLDVEMPGIDGISFLKEIMSTHPLPVIMVSAYTQENGQTTIRALSLGAVDFIPKPGPGLKEEKETFPQRLLAKIKEAAQARTMMLRSAPASAGFPGPEVETVRPPSQIMLGLVVGIGASTGGTQALTFLFSRLPENMPPIIIVQHMPSQFTASFAEHLDQVSPLRVQEGRNGDRLKKGQGLVIPGGLHGRIEKDRLGFFLTLSDDPPVNHHRPSVDVLFSSMAEKVGGKGIGILLTGMGEDGARGLLAMRKKGAGTLAQDESTSTIFGMPQAAIKLGAAQEVAPLEEIPVWMIKKTRT
ncbi:MAG: chemotaxis response regulator protein-glutamate methylesterase [Deltaproteobacteria bacterium]|nr:chemotaxis response regulator protein-glutamate methylesterase [Deltaproteobacteria bacterium]